MTPAVLGFCIGTTTMGLFTGSFLSGRLSAQMGTIRMILAGRVVDFAGLLAGQILYWLGAFNAVVFLGATAFVGVGNGLTTPSARAGPLSVRPHLVGSASGLSGALIVANGAVLTTVPGLVLTVGNGAWLLMLLMLASATGGLAAGFYVWRVDRQEGVPGR